MTNKTVEQLERELARANADADMYANAWAREIGPPYRAKSHNIDALVLTTRDRMQELRDLRERVKAPSVEVLKAAEANERGIWKRAMARIGWDDEEWIALTKEVSSIRNKTNAVAAARRENKP